MAREQKLKAYEMRLDGFTFQEIADYLGITRQAVHQGIPVKGETSPHCYKKIIYKNLRKYIEQKEISLSKFAELCRISCPTLYRILCDGSMPTKKTIDKILAATCMTYEEAFAREEGGGSGAE